MQVRTSVVRSGEMMPCSSARLIMLNAMRSFTLQGTSFVKLCRTQSFS